MLAQFCRPLLRILPLLLSSLRQVGQEGAQRGLQYQFRPRFPAELVGWSCGAGCVCL